MSEEKVEDMRAALAALYLSGLRMPRHTPDAGGAGTDHTYKLSAARVWNHDKAMVKAAEVLGITDIPQECCVGARSYNEDLADTLEDNARKILER